MQHSHSWHEALITKLLASVCTQLLALECKLVVAVGVREYNDACTHAKELYQNESPLIAVALIIHLALCRAKIPRQSSTTARLSRRHTSLECCEDVGVQDLMGKCVCGCVPE